MYGCERWTIKKAEWQIIDAFELWCWRRLLRVPWTARRWKQSILKEISPEHSLEGLIPKLKLQYFRHLMQRTDSLEKTLMLGKIEYRRWRVRQRMRWLDGITDSMDMSLSRLGVVDGQGGLDCTELRALLGFPGASDGKESTCNAGDLSSMPGLGRSPGGGLGNLPQCSCLNNPHGQRSCSLADCTAAVMDWQSRVHGVAKSQNTTD